MTWPSPHLLTYAERAAFYDLEHCDKLDNSFLVSLLTPSVRSVLDIPCGNGKNTVDLIRPGLRVFAVDREPRMIERVRQRVAGLPGAEDLETATADLRDFDLRETFDLITVQREAFQMVVGQSDAARALSSLRRHLAPGGTLVVDLATFSQGRSQDPETQPTYFDPDLPDGLRIAEWTKPLPWGGTMKRSRIQRHQGDVILIELFFEVRHPDGRIEEWSAEDHFQVYTKESFLSLAMGAGLVLHDLFRNYGREPFRPGDARMIFLLRQGEEKAS